MRFADRLLVRAQHPSASLHVPVRRFHLLRKPLLGAAIVCGLAATPLSPAAETIATTPAVNNIFTSMDVDRNGKVSRDEHNEGTRKMFETLDADRNGRVTASEMDAAREKVTGSTATKGDLPASAKIRAVDADGDGVLTAHEHALGGRTMFERMDKDGDGYLSRAEMAAGHAKMLRKDGK